MAKDSQQYLLYTAVAVEMVAYNARIAPVSYQDSKAVRKSSVFISKRRDVVKEVLATVDAQRRHQVGPDLGRHTGGERVDGTRTFAPRLPSQNQANKLVSITTKKVNFIESSRRSFKSRLRGPTT